MFTEKGEPIIKNGLLPVGYNNVTSFVNGGDLRGINYSVYECNFIATIEIDEQKQPQDVDRGILKTIVAKYYGVTDSTIQVESKIDFTGIDGGNAYTVSFDEVFEGGNAGTPFIDYDDEIEGGKADTNYDC